MSDRDEELPLVEPALVEWLERSYKNQCPSETDSDREIWIAVGSAKVVRTLRKIMEAQNENVLDESVFG